MTILWMLFENVVQNSMRFPSQYLAPVAQVVACSGIVDAVHGILKYDDTVGINRQSDNFLGISVKQGIEMRIIIQRSPNQSIPNWSIAA